MRVAVVGLGLIGGSLALAASARGDQVAAADRDPEAGRVGLERGAIGRFDDSLEGALQDAELAFVCGPVGELVALTRSVLEAAPDGCVVSDVGSTKGRLVERVGAEPRFVGGHPVCGSEARGVAKARPEL